MKKPDIETIKLWMEGSLDESALQQVESWADEQPDEAAQLIASLEADSAEMLDLSAMPVSIEPPYPEFLNSKIEQEIIRLEAPHSDVSKKAAAKSGMRLIDKLKFIFLPSAAAAMAVCFVLGMQVSNKIEGGATQQPMVVENEIYVPNDSVTVEKFSSDEATMIVLDGLEPIADDDIAMLGEVAPKSSMRMVSAEKREKIWY